METFADYILNEKDLASKMEIVYYLSKKKNIYFSKQIILKTELARLFVNYSKIEVDKNMLLTACLLCNCKKVDNAKDLETVRSYAKNGAEYLQTLGFGKKFCKICEEINRYSNSNPRERESDILELIDQFGSMILDRPERIGFKPDEALVILEHRNLKNEYNRYMDTFLEFVNYMENMKDAGKITPIRQLVKIYNETNELTKFIKEIVYNYEPKVDKLMEKYMKNEAIDIFNKLENPNRPLFSEKTAKKIMNNINEKQTVKIEE